MTNEPKKPILAAAGTSIGGIVLMAILSALLSRCDMARRPEAPPPIEERQPTPAAPVEAAAPDNGLPPMGYNPNPEGVKVFLRSLDKPTIREAGPELFKQSIVQPVLPQANEPVLLYRALYDVHRKTYGRQWECGTQKIGDCVSWGWAHGIDIAAAVEYELGNLDEWKLAATEAIYGGARVEGSGRSSGGYSDGSYGAAAARWVATKGGVLYRENYEKFDLTVYSGQRAKAWGNFGCGGQGDNGWADAVAKQHPVKHVALVVNFEEAAAAITSGYPVPVCSGQGFTSTRDQDGFCRPSGSWSHCMCFIAVRHDRPGLLCLNSWGPDWVNGPKWPDDQPDGSFWVDAKTATAMLRGEDSFAVSAADGFPLRPLNNAEWLGSLPHDQSSSFALAP